MCFIIEIYFLEQILQGDTQRSSTINKLIVTLMKKTVIIAIGLILISFHPLAAQYVQSKTSNDIKFGIKVSPAFTWFEGVGINPNYETDGADLKINAGFIFINDFTENYALVTGFNINTFGGGLKDLTATPNTTKRYTFSEVEIPVGLRLKTAPFGNICYVAELGLGASYIFKALDSNDINVALQTYPFRLSYNIGAGIEYTLQNNTILLGQLNFNGGLTNIFRSSSFPTQMDYKPTIMEITVGVLF